MRGLYWVSALLGLPLLVAAASAAVAELPLANRESPFIVINTWGFTEATEAAREVLRSNGSALDAVEQASGDSPAAALLHIAFVLY